MKRIILILLSIVCNLFFSACNKNDKYEIEIIVPAGSQEEFVYSEEEIMATGNQITIYSGAGLGDTEVILKPVDETVETGYVAEYLTHGMPVKLDAVKGEWFKVGVAVQNDSERGPIAVSVEVEGVEVRISSKEDIDEENISNLKENQTEPVALEEELITFGDKVFKVSDLSQETIEWLQKYNELSEAEQLAISSIPADLYELCGYPTMEDMEDTVNDEWLRTPAESVDLEQEDVQREWTEKEIANLFEAKAQSNWELLQCLSVSDYAYERVGVALYADDSKPGHINVAFIGEEENMQHCGVEAVLDELPQFTYLGNGEVTFRVCSKNGEEYTQKISFSTDGEQVNFVAEAIRN